jgi:hypothetical protein
MDYVWPRLSALGLRWAAWAGGWATNLIKIAKIRSLGRKRYVVYFPKCFHRMRDIPMRIAVQADEGDEVSISADFISIEQAVVTLEIENALYNSQIEIETVTLTIDKARELAKALLSVTEAIEFVRTPTNLLRLDRKSHPLPNMN